MVMDSGGSDSVISRAIRAAMLDRAFYRTIGTVPEATGQAAMIVSAVAIAGGIGALIGQFFVGDSRTAITRGILALIVAIVGQLLTWLIWSYAVYLVARGSFSANETFQGVLRPIGFAQTPMLLSLFRFIPLIGWLIYAVAVVWSLVAGYIAVKEGLGITTGQAIITIVIALIVFIILGCCVGIVLAPLGLGVSTLPFGA